MSSHGEVDFLLAELAYWARHASVCAPAAETLCPTVDEIANKLTAVEAVPWAAQAAKIAEVKEMLDRLACAYVRSSRAWQGDGCH